MRIQKSGNKVYLAKRDFGVGLVNSISLETQYDRTSSKIDTICCRFVIFTPINRNFMVTYFDACEILEMLSEASVKVFLDGGWGVDALIGRETRIHNDIDLFVEKKDYCITISVITGKGYREVIMDYTTDSHTVWKDDNGRIIDLHSFEYVEDGILYEGYTFPSDTFSGKGNIGNIEVTCINPEAQVQFHLGYEYDENDVHDVLLLCRTFNLEIPEQYKTHI